MQLICEISRQRGFKPSLFAGVCGFKRMALLLVAVTFLSAEKQPAKRDCIVAGHGPYLETKQGCESLGEAQARTSCVLTEKDSSVTLKFSETTGKVRTASCRALRILGKDECELKKCRWNADQYCASKTVFAATEACTSPRIPQTSTLLSKNQFSHFCMG
jgi:hypothetical protein